jgi:hypothetical protein
MVRAPKEAVLAIGSCAIARVRDGARGVSLTADDGMTELATVAGGVAVEIVAWLPRRGAGALYRVRATTGGRQEGWVPATSLEPVQLPRQRRSVQAAAAPAKPTRAGAPRRAPAR